MANVLVLIRLSPQFAAALDRATEYLDLSPSQLVEMLLKRSEPYQKELLRAPLEGPFPEKINLRLSPEVMHLLRRLTGYREVRPGEFVYGRRPLDAGGRKAVDLESRMRCLRQEGCYTSRGPSSRARSAISCASSRALAGTGNSQSLRLACNCSSVRAPTMQAVTAGCLSTHLVPS